MKSFDARNNDRFLRNSFYPLGKYDITALYKQETDTGSLLLIGFHNTKIHDAQNADKAVHFYIDDYKFECIWNRPERYLRRLSQYRFVLTPDFSLYTNMPLAMQI